MKAIWCGLVVLLLISSGLVVAQDYFYGSPPDYYGSRAATPGESHARGMSDVIRSQGQYNVQTSEAAINMTEAQRNHIQNRDQWTNTYFEMREINRKSREAERSPRPSMESLVRYAQAGKPKRMSPSELDSVAGTISWPTLLQTDQYAAYRSELEGLFAKRAHDGVVGTNDYLQIDKTTKAMLAELKKQVREVPQMDYIAAKRFLESLAFESKLSAS